MKNTTTKQPLEGYENEVREYTDKPIFITDKPFPKNHLYCVRGKLCEFAEHQDFVDVYVYPTPDSKEGLHTHGEWKMMPQVCSDQKILNNDGRRNHFVIGYDDYEEIDIWYTIGEDKEVAQENAELIISAVNESLRQKRNRETKDSFYSFLIKELSIMDDGSGETQKIAISILNRIDYLLK